MQQDIAAANDVEHVLIADQAQWPARRERRELEIGSFNHVVYRRQTGEIDGTAAGINVIVEQFEFMF